MNKIKIISHRGGFLPEGPIPTISQYEIPENTLEAFERSFKKCWGVETDVRKTKDGKFVIIHDSKVKRFSNAGGNVEDMILTQIQNQHYIYGSQFTIPTLEKLCTLSIKYGKDTNNPFIAFQIKSANPKDELEIGQAIAVSMEKCQLKNSILSDVTVEVAKQLRKEFSWLNLSVSVGEKNYSPTIYTPKQVLISEFKNAYNCIWADEWKVPGSIYNQQMFKVLKEAYPGRIDIISPELHYNEDHPLAKNLDKLKKLWLEIINWGIADGICTDYPTQLQLIA